MKQNFNLHIAIIHISICFDVGKKIALTISERTEKHVIEYFLMGFEVIK